jgi:hypothetical protein
MVGIKKNSVIGKIDQKSLKHQKKNTDYKIDTDETDN